MALDSTIQIRPYEPGDRDDLITIVRELQSHERQFFDRMKPPEDIGAWYVEDLLKQCRDSSGEILVLESEGRIAGYATILTDVVQDDPDEMPYSYALIGDLAVAGNMRCRGLGKRLMEECERRAREGGAKWLRISVLARNSHALTLYRKLGFADHVVDLEKPLAES